MKNLLIAMGIFFGFSMATVSCGGSEETTGTEEHVDGEHKCDSTNCSKDCKKEGCNHEGKCADKCGEGKCADKCGEGKCADKCGEGKCADHKCGEGKCGEGKCGGADSSATEKCGH